MATRLGLYNGALLELGERGLSALTDNQESRRLLDVVWNDGVIDHCLSAGQWCFALRSVKISHDENIIPSFGHPFAFKIPPDFIRTARFCSDEFQINPVLKYTQEGGYWFASIDPIFLTYVSNGSQFGGDLTRWPSDFTRYVEICLAGRIASKITQDKDKQNRLFALEKKLRIDAAAGDAMEGPTRFFPAGSFVRARAGGRRLNYEVTKTTIL